MKGPAPEAEVKQHVLQPLADGLQQTLERLREAKDTALSWQRYELASDLRTAEHMVLQWQKELKEMNVLDAPPKTEQDNNGKAENRTE